MAGMGVADLRQKLGRPGDGPVLGAWIMYVRTPGIVRMAAAAGVDFVCVDLQHSAFGWETVADFCEVARAAGVAAVVRPHVVDHGTVNRIQDLGAAGVMIPDVDHRRPVDDCVDWVRYPPRGHRGVSVGGPAADYDIGPLDAAAAEAADGRQVVAVQVETDAGVAALESVLAAGGVDLVEVGRNDLAASLGVPGDLRHRRVEAAVDAVVDTSRRHDVPVAATAGSVDDVAALVDRGVSCVMWRTDKSILLASYRDFTAAAASATS